jgi:Tol biopolymer transport system component
MRQRKPYAEIAVGLGISVAGVKYHVANMVGKLGLADRDELVAWEGETEGVSRRWQWLGAIGWKWAGLAAAGVAVGGVAVVALAVLLDSGDQNGSDGAGGVFTAPFDPADLATAALQLTADGSVPNGFVGPFAVSANGRWIAFESAATNLVPHDTNGASDVFVFDRLLKTTVRASVSSTGAQAKNRSGTPSISADGRYVAFESTADNLVPDDTNGEPDNVFKALPDDIRDVVRRQPDAAAAFGGSDVFVRDMATGKLERVSIDSGGRQANLSSAAARLSADGRFVAFESSATNLVPGDTNAGKGHPLVNSAALIAGIDVFVHDRNTGETERVSVATDGAQAEGTSLSPAISADGRYVAFVSDANSLAGDNGRPGRVYLRDRLQRTTRQIPIPEGQDPNGFGQVLHFSPPAISADGLTVAFGLLGLQGTGIYVYDAKTGVTTGIEPDEPNAGDQFLSLSGDGGELAFTRYIDPSHPQVMVYDTASGKLDAVDFDGAPAGYPVLSASGQEVMALSATKGSSQQIVVAQR